MVELQSIFAQLIANPVVIVGGVLALIALLRTVFLSRRISLLMQGKDGKSLEDTIQTLHARVHTLEEHATKSELALNNLDERLRSAVRGVAVKRFDPFQNAGGQQSFTSALLNEDGDGVVISGIHARDSVRVYAKEVKKFVSEHELSDDERSAITNAKQKLGT